MKRLLLLTTVAATAITATGVAVAADLPMATKAPPGGGGLPPMPMFSWTGCYIGAHVGVGEDHTQFQDTLPVGDLDAFATSRAPHTNGAGGVFGGQLGCDLQVSGNWVLGLQGTISGSDINSTNQDQFNAQWTLTSNINWYGTVTGRVGWAMNNIMFYGKGGGAWANTKLEVENSGATIFGPQNITRMGWTIGTGIEWGFAPSWSAFAEVNYYSFGNTTSGPFLPLMDTFPEPFNSKLQFETFTVGVNYRFRGW